MRLFGGGAGLGARQLPVMIVDRSVQCSFYSKAMTTKRRIPPCRSAGSLPRFLWESAAAELGIIWTFILDKNYTQYKCIH